MSYTSASGVEGHPVAHGPKISQIEGNRPQPREWPGRNIHTLVTIKFKPTSIIKKTHALCGESDLVLEYCSRPLLFCSHVDISENVGT
ncbi:hypothetical protein CRG98_005234 [Punica granatum]|uniref:Uncharacterized protein n=1 Tax=Punica granatum TaxID=22663 RepID=A0A2I0L0W2_PUNGR|nr:hypothetical protein CRG98_005234 [Punica granatum]